MAVHKGKFQSVFTKVLMYVIPSVVFCTILYLLFFRAMGDLTTEFFYSKPERYLVFALCSLIAFLAVWSKIGYRVFLVFWIGSFAVTAMFNLSYSSDEGSHLDFVNHIITYKELPVVSDLTDAGKLNAGNYSIDSIYPLKNYEAVQAPLYYLVLVPFGWLIKNMPMRVRMLRLLTLAMVLAGIYVTKKTFDLLKEWGLYREGEGEVFLRMVSLLTVFCPGYLIRGTRLSNEALLCLLIPMLLYVGLKCLKEGYSSRAYWVMSAICLGCFMTKNTAIFVYAVIGIIALIQGKFKKAILPVLAGVPVTIPWLIFNYRAYGHLTGMAEHIEFVKPIVNPTDAGIDVFDEFLNMIGPSFWYGEDIAPLGNAGIMIHTVYMIGAACLFFIIVRLTKEIWTCFRSGWKKELSLRMKINLVCAGILLAAFIVLSAGAISTRLPSVRGRYFHGAAGSIIILAAINLRSLSTWGKKVILLLLGLFAGVLIYNTIDFFMQQTSYQHKVFAVNVKSIELEDVSDETWTHGISKDGMSIRVPAGPDYSCLKDRMITIGDQDRIIVGSYDEEAYSCLMISVALDPEVVEENGTLITLGDNLEWREIPDNGSNFRYKAVEEDTVFYQSYHVDSDQLIGGFSFYAGTYAKTLPETDITYLVRDDTGKCLEENSIVYTDMEDNAWDMIYLKNVYKIEEGRTIYIELQVKENGVDEIVVNSANRKFDPGNGEPVTKQKVFRSKILRTDDS